MNKYPRGGCIELSKYDNLSTNIDTKYPYTLSHRISINIMKHYNKRWIQVQGKVEQMPVFGINQYHQIPLLGLKGAK